MALCHRCGERKNTVGHRRCRQTNLAFGTFFNLENKFSYSFTCRVFVSRTGVGLDDDVAVRWVGAVDGPVDTHGDVQVLADDVIAGRLQSRVTD